MKKLALFFVLLFLRTWILGGLEYSHTSDPSRRVSVNKSSSPQRSFDRKRIPPRRRRLGRTRSNSVLDNDLWAWVFGGERTDWFNSLIKMSDGGCVFISVASNDELSVVKLLPDGNISFQKNYGGIVYEVGYLPGHNEIILTSNGDFVFVFSRIIRNSNSGIDIEFVKASPDLDSITTHYILKKDWDIENSNFYQKTKDLGFAAGECENGDFYILGLSNFDDLLGDLVVFKISTSEKRIVWKKKPRIDGRDYPSGIIPTKDGGCYVFGNSTSFNNPGGGDAWVIRFSSTGECLWQKTFGGSYNDMVYSAFLTPEEGLILAGSTSSFGNGDSDFWLFEITPVGDIKPGRQIAIGGEQNEIVYSIDKAMNGDILLGGITNSSGNGNEDFLVIRVSPDLNVKWAKTYGGKANEHVRSIQEALDGSLYVAGTTASFGYVGWWYYLRRIEDILILKLSPNGETSVPDLSHNMDVVVKNTNAAAYDSWAPIIDSDLILHDGPYSGFSNYTQTPLPVNVNTLYPPVNVYIYDIEVDNTLFKENTYFKLFWEKNPLNKNLDIEKYRIYQKRPSDNVFSFLLEVQNEDAMPDSNVYIYEGLLKESDEGVEYRITALDADGRESGFSEVAEYWPGRK